MCSHPRHTAGKICIIILPRIILTHTPYSIADFSPCDCWLFSMLKQRDCHLRWLFSWIQSKSKDVIFFRVQGLVSIRVTDCTWNALSRLKSCVSRKGGCVSPVWQFLEEASFLWWFTARLSSEMVRCTPHAQNCSDLKESAWRRQRCKPTGMRACDKWATCKTRLDIMTASPVPTMKTGLLLILICCLSPGQDV